MGLGSVRGGVRRSMYGRGFFLPSGSGTAPGGGGGGFARKPIVPTPSIKSGPGFGRTIYVDFDAGNDANDGLTTSTPWRTIDYLESNKLAGDLIYMKGTTSGVNSYFGKGTTTGTSSAWITYTLWPSSTLTFMNGGLPNAYNAIFGGNLVYHCFYNLPLDGTSGASLGWDSGGICQLTGSSNVWFIGCTFNNTAFRCLNTSDCRLYDCNWTGSFGDFVNNTGDMCYMANSSHRFWLIRNHFDARSGHGCCDLGNPTSGSTICNDPYVFDCYFKNPAAGGFYFVGDCRNAIAEWNTMEYMGTDQGAAHVGSTDGCQLTAPGTIFRFNIVKNNFRHGAIIDSTEAFGGQFAINNHIYNNVFYNNGNIGNAIKPAQGGQGIYHGGGAGNMNCQTGWTGNIIENNICWNNGKYTNGSADPPDYNSGFYGGAYSQIWVDEYNVSGGGSATWATGNIYGNIWRNNIYGGANGYSGASTGFYLLVRSSGNEQLTKAQFEAAHPECSGNLVHQDPLFVDAANGDFRLQAGSPARNAGYAALGLTFLEAAPDIGVYEYGGAD